MPLIIDEIDTYIEVTPDETNLLLDTKLIEMAHCGLHYTLCRARSWQDVYRVLVNSGYRTKRDIATLES